MHNRFGWRPKYQFRYVNWLWDRESSWNVYATNPYSGAYGIPQAVPGSKMASAGPRWQTSARTQIRWGLRYIKSRYGKPSRAWAHEQRLRLVLSSRPLVAAGCRPGARAGPTRGITPTAPREPPASRRWSTPPGTGAAGSYGVLV